MSNTPYVRAAMAQAALELTPPLIRKTLLEARAFREEYGFRADAVLSVGDSGFSIQRSELFDAIRKILSGASELDVTDTEDREWKLQNEAENGDLPELIISSDERQLALPGFAVFSPDPSIRLRSLDKAASDVNLPAAAEETWRNVLSERPLEDEEIDEYNSDFCDTPVHIARSIRSEIKTGRSSVSSLVPSSRRYFDRLVGGYNGSASIRDYAAGAGKQFIEQLSAWRPYDGFLFGLFLSSHSALTVEITAEQIGREGLVRAFDFLEKQGDGLSQLGAIEVGFHILPKCPEIEPHIIRLVEQVLDDNIDGSTRGLKLLSALFVLVDGELSRIRLMSSEPPFYRRLASLSQAALIHRQLVNTGVDDTFCEWAFSKRGEQYYMQSLADMRLEPRWNPDLAAAVQMKADFFGRIVIAAKNYEQNIKNTSLYNLILGTDPDSVQSLCKFPHSYYPGPLEGAEDSQNDLPSDLSDAIEAQLNADEVGPSSFIALVNSAMIFRLDSDQVELAAKALNLGNHRLANVEDKSNLLGILNGLASECRYLVKDFGTSLSPKSTRLRDSLYCPGRPASVPLRHTIASSVQAPQHSHNGLTACRMSLQIFSAATGNTPLRHYENPPGPTPTGDYQPSLRSPWLAATVAAAARSSALADELRILVRRYRRDAQYGLSIEEALRICLVASASREELIDWREFAGDWLTELAFDEFEGDEGNVLHSHLQFLCHAVPELWVTCARADAALKAFNSR